MMMSMLVLMFVMVVLMMVMAFAGVVMPGAVAVVMVVIMLVTVQQVRSPEENGSQNDYDSGSNHICEITSGWRQAG
ncbi:exported protein of unknown function [Pseudodesulfovibrio piezophilus C1TLV30]|uniref:Uncharacterized protein n=1 Tax=Pseudodesulfovibrio piezophilus (strain DSM 21447 / JCM 15486 / C1TLV30) TaxID=1322246 RepID=M1WPA3_PSEP2|nr:exported protein of unknown function [Pseudodesulfovibrio piezophilus C1TLV30]